MRHGVSQEVAKLKGTTNLEKLEKIIQRPDFEQRLKWATKNVAQANSCEGKKIRGELEPFIKRIGSKMKWTTFERASATHSSLI